MSCCCGPHISLGKTLYDTACVMHGTRADAIQVFYGNYISYNIRNFTEDDIKKTGDFLRNENRKIYVHAPYVINLASDKEDMVQKGKSCLQKILDTQAQVDNERTGTVLHIGAQGTIQNVVNQLNDLNVSSPLLLENSAGEGTKLGKDSDELRKLKEGIDSHRVGFCLDTCHCHSSGMCDMTSPECVVKMFEGVHDFGCKRVMVHLNDSQTKLGSKKDRHAIVGQGTIWNKEKDESFESLRTLGDFCKENSHDIILETPSDNIKFEFEILKK
jgi:deoxyribonuclease-4